MKKILFAIASTMSIAGLAYAGDPLEQRRYPRKACDQSTEIVGEVVYRQTERI